jgi:hypothetical protein
MLRALIFPRSDVDNIFTGTHFAFYHVSPKDQNELVNRCPYSRSLTSISLTVQPRPHDYIRAF